MLLCIDILIMRYLFSVLSILNEIALQKEWQHCMAEQIFE